MLVAAILLGGGGRSAVMSNLIVQLVALGTAWFYRSDLADGWANLGWPLRILLIATLALPLIQLVPLPPAVWKSLPGREMLAETYAVLGLEDGWAPVSLTPGITGLAAIGLVVPSFVLLLATRLDPPSQARAMMVLAGCALVGVAVGVVQLLTGNAVGNIYGSRVLDYLYGTFASHNAAGLFFVAATAAVVEWIFLVRARGAALITASTVGVLFVLATLLTQSRSATALLVVPLVLVFFHLFGRGRVESGGLTTRQKALGGIVALAIIGTGAAMVMQGTGRLAQMAERFEKTSENRPELWEDAWVSAERYWPVGSGVGTFDEVFQIDESLETLIPLKAGRAHNDYLELAIDSGIFGVSLVFIWILYLAIAAYRRSQAGGVSTAFIVGLALAFAAHSMLDFPLRNQAMLCIAALIVGLLVGPRGQYRKRTDDGSSY